MYLHTQGEYFVIGSKPIIMKNNIPSLFLVLPGLLNLVSAQGQSDWEIFADGHTVNVLAESPSYIWAGTRGGLIQIDRNTDEQIVRNTGNSDLPHNNVNSLAVDSQQVLWISTQKGLAKLDQGILTCISDSLRGALAIDDQNRLWIANETALYSYDQGVVQKYPYPFMQMFGYQLSFNQGTGELWGTAYTFGAFLVFRFDGTNWQTYDTNNTNLPFEGPDNTIATTPFGDIYVGLSGGLYKYDNDSTWQRFDSTNSPIKSVLIYQIAADQTGTLYILEQDDFQQPVNLYQLQSGSWSIISTVPDSLVSMTNMLASSIRDERWVFDVTHGLYKENQGNWNSYPTAYIPFNPRFVSVFKHDTTNQEIFLGENGLNGQPKRIWRYRNNEWQATPGPVLTNPENAQLADITIAPDGTMWVAMLWEGVFYWENNTWNRWVPNNIQLTTSLIERIAFAPDGTMWGTEDGRTVFSWTTTNANIYTTQDHGISSGTPRSLTFNPVTGDLWFASYVGFSRFDGSNWETTTQWGGSIFHTTSVAFAPDGSTWIAGTQALLKHDAGSLSAFSRSAATLPEGRVRDMGIGTSGDLWISMDDTLYARRDNQWERFHNKNSAYPGGFTSNIIIQKNGTVWTQSYDFISRYNKDGLTSIGGGPNNDFEESISLFPNPVRKGEAIHIEGESFHFNRIELLDTSGRILLRKKLSTPATISRLELPADFLSKGILFLRIRKGREARVMKVLVLE
jgi:ligand-binding sensor domain-containing protein